MKINYEVPFYANTPDNMHCLQASLRMVLKYFKPEEEFSWKELEKITARVDGLWTWTTAGFLWMHENGFEIKNIDPFDSEQFIKLGGEYLIEEFGEEMGQAQIIYSNIEQEQELSEQFLEKIKTEKRIPEQDDLKKILHEGFLIVCNVNSQALNQQEGYGGHFVVIKGYDENSFIIHDPGLPPLENRKVSFEIFEKAWAYPNEKAKNITAFRLKK